MKLTPISRDMSVPDKSACDHTNDSSAYTEQEISNYDEYSYPPQGIKNGESSLFSSYPTILFTDYSGKLIVKRFLCKAAQYAVETNAVAPMIMND